MNILKYIINKNKVPIIFSSTIMHNEVLQEGSSGGYIILKWCKKNNLFSVKCYGESSSLNISSRFDDETLIEDFLNNQFFMTLK
jgi:hypothetical protein